VTRIVTDSTADIPVQLAADLGVTVVPAVVMFGAEALQDGVDISRDEFYRRLPNSRVHPTTSAASAGVFARTYETVGAQDPEIISVHVAATLSGMVNSANVGAGLVTQARVTVVDSGSASMGLGLQVLDAARMAREGARAPDILARLADLRRRAVVYAMIDTLEYLKRSGRVRGLHATIGNLLRIKPMLRLRDGELVSPDMVITRAAAVTHLLNRLKELAPLQSLCVLHSAALRRARAFAVQAAHLLGVEPPMVVQAGSAVGSHTGPGCIGFAAISGGS
jgi:DegV family protein with EDD domain